MLEVSCVLRCVGIGVGLGVAGSKSQIHKQCYLLGVNLISLLVLAGELGYMIEDPKRNSPYNRIFAKIGSFRSNPSAREAMAMIYLTGDPVIKLACGTRR